MIVLGLVLGYLLIGALICIVLNLTVDISGREKWEAQGGDDAMFLRVFLLWPWFVIYLVATWRDHG